MRFRVFVKATKNSEAGVMPSEEALAAMAHVNEEMVKAGVLLDGNGLHPSSKAWRFTWSGDKKTYTDGPFTEVKELVAGYTMIQVKSREEALKDYERNLTRQMTTSRTPAAQAAIDRIHDQTLQMETRLHRTGGPPPPVPAGYSMALGSAYFRLNQLPDAEREYKAAIQVDPSFGEAHSNLAVVYFVTGRIAEADAALKAATKAGFKVNPRLKDDVEAAMKKRG
jgi:hypothetical protein